MSDPGRTDVRFVMLGLPTTGKTTFLAALWNALEDEGAPGRLRCKERPQLAGYLTSIQTAWLSGEPVPRTSRDTAEVIELRLTDSDGSVFTLAVPDLNGEVLETLWTDREGPDAVVETLRTANAIMLFIHPDRLKRTNSIVEVARAAAAKGLSIQQALGAEETERPYAPGGVDTQVQLLALIQDADEQREERGEPWAAVAVIISAWELVTDVDPTIEPKQFLTRELPLLDQYLSAHADQRQTTIFGISAQGGDYASRAAELVDADQATRVIVSPDVGEDGEVNRHDITAPIRWLARAANQQ